MTLEKGDRILLLMILVGILLFGQLFVTPDPEMRVRTFSAREMLAALGFVMVVIGGVFMFAKYMKPITELSDGTEK